MKGRRGRLREILLPLLSPLGTAHGGITERRGWLVEVENEEGSGLRGFGEATPLPNFGTETLGVCRQVLETFLSHWVKAGARDEAGGAPTSVRDLLKEMHRDEGAPTAMAGLEAALFDLAARSQGRSLASEIRTQAGLGGPPAESIATQALVGGVEPEAVAASARAAALDGFSAFKLKLAVHPGAPDLGEDLERVAALREVVGPRALLRLDANEAWSVVEALTALARLERFGIDYVEQPVSRVDFPGLKRLSDEGAVPVAADEALQGEGLARCLELEAAQILVVKPAALGGVSPALVLAERAAKRGLRLVWSTLIDGAVGRALPLALAAGLGPEDEVHGLGTARLLAADLAGQGPGEAVLFAGRLLCSSSPGIGFVPVCPGSGPSADPVGRVCFEVRG